MEACQRERGSLVKNVTRKAKIKKRRKITRKGNERESIIYSYVTLRPAFWQRREHYGDLLLFVRVPTAKVEVHKEILAI